MRIAVLSDLHLGTRTRIDLLRSAEVRARLMSFLRDFDEVVLLGDALELRDRPLSAVIAAAEPFLTELGATLGNGRVVLVPGNHDHRLAPRDVDGRGSGVRGDLLREVRRGERGAAGAVRDRVGTELLIAYPGWRPAPHVWATHGHYLDAHSAAPTLECALAAAISAIRGAPAAGADAAAYEALLSPTYDLYYWIAQRPRLQRLADLGKRLVRLVETRLGTRGVPRQIERPAPRLGGERRGTAPGELRRPGLLPFGMVLDRLGIDAEHVLFGHTHRTAPLTTDDPRLWRAPGGAALWNTGSWVAEPDYVGRNGTGSPYWPGTVVTVEGSGPPAIYRLLDERSIDSAYDLDSRSTGREASGS